MTNVTNPHPDTTTRSRAYPPPGSGPAGLAGRDRLGLRGHGARHGAALRGHRGEHPFDLFPRPAGGAELGAFEFAIEGMDFGETFFEPAHDLSSLLLGLLVGDITGASDLQDHADCVGDPVRG